MNKLNYKTHRLTGVLFINSSYQIHSKFNTQFISNLFNYPVINPFVPSLKYLVIHSLIHQSVYSFICILFTIIHTFIWSLSFIIISFHIHSGINSFSHSLTQPFILSLALFSCLSVYLSICSSSLSTFIVSSIHQYIFVSIHILFVSIYMTI